MTIYEWRKLKPGDVVWVCTHYFSFGILGVVKRQNGKKGIWVNLFGDVQFFWYRDDMEKMLRCVVPYRDNVPCRELYEVEATHLCNNCRSRVKFRHNPERWCSKRRKSPESANRCMYWRLSKTRKNAKKTENETKHTNETS